jgi:hypothetical protein
MRTADSPPVRSRFHAPAWVSDAITIGFLLLPFLGVCAAIAAFALGAPWPLIVSPFPLSLVATGFYFSATSTISLAICRYWAYATGILGLTILGFSYWSGEVGGDAYFAVALGGGLLALVLALAVPIGVGLALGAGIAHWRGLKLRALFPLAVYALHVGVGALVFIAGISGISLPSAHADDAMIAHFQANRVPLDRLLQMANEDANLARIGPDIVEEPRFMRVALPDARWNEYRQLFRQAGVQGIIRQGGDIRFEYWTAPLMTAFSSKGFAYRVDEPDATVESLDRINWDPKVSTVYRVIEPNWYLYRYRVD